MQGIFGLAVDLILRSKLVFALDFLMNCFGTYVSLLYAQASTFNAVFLFCTTGHDVPHGLWTIKVIFDLILDKP